MNFGQSIDQLYGESTYENEDKPVLAIIESFRAAKTVRYLEIGSGLGRFPFILKSKFENFQIECLEINPELAKITRKAGLKTIVADIRSANFKQNSFEIIHCSHLIEHLPYPDVADLLDKMAGWLKPGGYLIIRSPLMHERFYDDIDHIRPYPPEAIINYFHNPQQQKKGKASLKVRAIWKREEGLSSSNRYLRTIFEYLWINFRWPKAKPNGFVLAMQKT